MLRNDLERADTNATDSLSEDDRFKLGLTIGGVQLLLAMGSTLLLGKYVPIALAPVALFDLGCLNYVAATKERVLQSIKNDDRLGVALSVGGAALSCGLLFAVGFDKEVADAISSDNTNKVLARVAGAATNVLAGSAIGLFSTLVNSSVNDRRDNAAREHGAVQEQTEHTPLVARPA